MVDISYEDYVTMCTNGYIPSIGENGLEFTKMGEPGKLKEVLDRIGSQSPLEGRGEVLHG